MTDKQRQILILLAKHSMNMSEVARIMHYNRNTIIYHIERIREETGKDPLNLFDLADMLGWKRVVRCKDCKYRVWFGSNYCCANINSPFYACAHETSPIVTKPSDFCSYGELREGEG